MSLRKSQGSICKLILTEFYMQFFFLLEINSLSRNTVDIYLYFCVHLYVFHPSCAYRWLSDWLTQSSKMEGSPRSPASLPLFRGFHQEWVWSRYGKHVDETQKPTEHRDSLTDYLRSSFIYTASDPSGYFKFIIDPGSGISIVQKSALIKKCIDMQPHFLGNSLTYTIKNN